MIENIRVDSTLEYYTWLLRSRIPNVYPVSKSELRGFPVSKKEQ